ncbi:MAG: T6SS effector amidase Tae4 family protein [Lysobacter sp.]
MGLSTGDGALIIYRVTDLRNYLAAVFGKPMLDNTSPYDDEFKGRKGITSFKVNWAGATGHIALWDGVRYREPSYDNYSTYVSESNSTTRTSGGKFWRVA